MWLPGTSHVKISRDVVFVEEAPAHIVEGLSVAPDSLRVGGEIITETPDADSRTRSRPEEILWPCEYALAAVEDDSPATYQEAMQSDAAKQWEQAAASEYSSLMSNRTWVLADPPPSANVIKSKWVFRVKRHPDGSVSRYKARLVVKGCSQKEGIDYFETYAPVTRMTSIRCLLSLAAVNDLELVQCDVTTAFLYGDLEEDIFMRQPEGYDDGSGRVCKLQKSRYGLKQAPLQWNKKIAEALSKLGMRACSSDPCVYVRDSDKLIFALYVDDGLCMAPRI